MGTCLFRFMRIMRESMDAESSGVKGAAKKLYQADMETIYRNARE